MWELNHKEGWTPFWTVVLEKTLESSLDFMEINSVNPKGNQSWIFLGRSDAEVEASILWPYDEKNWLIRKDPDAGKDWRWRSRGWQRMRWLDGIQTQWTWLWASPGRWWSTGKPGVQQSMGPQRAGHDWVTEQQQQNVIGILVEIALSTQIVLSSTHIFDINYFSPWRWMILFIFVFFNFFCQCFIVFSDRYFTSLVKFISKYIIIFDAIVNRIAFLIS